MSEAFGDDLGVDAGLLSGRGFLTGDAVNVAARLQTTAPPMDVVVGALTYSRAGNSFAFEAMLPPALKGRTDRVEAWLVKGALGGAAPRGVEVSSPAMVPWAMALRRSSLPHAMGSGLGTSSFWTSIDWYRPLVSGFVMVTGSVRLKTPNE